MEDRPDEAESAEEIEHPQEVGDETPEADALEQAAELRPGEDDDDGELGDVPEADALEQRRGLGSDEDDDRR